MTNISQLDFFIGCLIGIYICFVTLGRLFHCEISFYQKCSQLCIKQKWLCHTTFLLSVWTEIHKKGGLQTWNYFLSSHAVYTNWLLITVSSGCYFYWDYCVYSQLFGTRWGLSHQSGAVSMDYIYIRSCRSTCVYCLIKINISPGAISSYPAGISDRRVMVFQDIFFFSADFLIILTAKHAADIKWARKCICDWYQSFWGNL